MPAAASRRLRPALAHLVSVVLGAVALAGCATDAAAPAGGAPPSARPGDPLLAGEVIQLRRDEALERVEIAVRNTSDRPVVVRRLELLVPGYDGAGPVAKDSPVPPGRVVNLPTPYGEVRCGPRDRPAVGRPEVRLLVQVAGAARPRSLVLAPTDPHGLLARIAQRTCTARRLAQEVRLRFVAWRAVATPDGTVLRGRLVARLLVDQPRRVTAVAGSVIYRLTARGARPGPLAVLRPDERTAAVAVQVSAARCDGHAIGETKKPYAFLVWIGLPGGAEHAVTPPVGPDTVSALQQVCRL